MSLIVESISHFAISVKSIDESIRWYRDVLGFKYLRCDYDDGIKAVIAYMEGCGIVIQMFEVKNASMIPEYRKYPDTDIMVHGNKHLAFKVLNFKDAISELKKLGIEMIDNLGDWCGKGVFVSDPSGNLIEFKE